MRHIRWMPAAVAAGVACVVACLAGCGPSGKLTVDQSTPQAALRTLTRAIALEDGAAARDCLLRQTPVQKDYGDALAQLVNATKKLCDAGADRYGGDADKQLVASPGAIEEAYSPFDMGRRQINGDDAIFTSSDGRVLRLRHQDGLWRVVPQADAMERATALMRSTGAFMSRAADEIAGTHAPPRRASATEAKASIAAEFQNLLHQSGPPPATTSSNGL